MEIDTWIGFRFRVVNNVTEMPIDGTVCGFSDKEKILEDNRGLAQKIEEDPSEMARWRILWELHTLFKGKTPAEKKAYNGSQKRAARLLKELDNRSFFWLW